ncbi:enoyl-CoA hydratase/isomerase family protein [Novosphingobium album (ex Liu et al. 2023)]|uniref:Enoyl-CoA hydratase/isomerase family protein n=1 Tax=Novosphingobium album (ex Liu et al. 2023) TaxID=3031130 RepID=A0ABT5WNY7_9SPHN|nr:enoyl-CoA hydratase/isomerase family protein [Novosphingobium album (ex Liu et al. 2023)]MDE8650982.1 enoyl-CoA hydratase/isomerase family protein [Novosphingobium album (ex Liu et al. 2023)]
MSEISSDAAVLHEVGDGVALLTINRPKTLNALDLPTLDALEAAVKRAAADPAVKAIVFTGAGKAFVAGGDIADLESRQGLAHYLEFGERIHAVFSLIEALDKPTVAAVNGWALGGGTELLLCTDLRVVARSAMLGLPEITLGLFPGAGGSQRLLRQVSPCKARELMFLGERISAEEAHRIGLVNAVVEDGEVVDAALAMGAKLAAKSAMTLRLLKRALRDGAEMPPSAALRHEQAMIGLVLDSRDAHEGCKAFLEKRPAEFEGR